MTTTTTTTTTAHVHPRRPLVPALNLLLAGGAVALGVIAITSDDVATITRTPALPPVVVEDTNEPGPTAPVVVAGCAVPVGDNMTCE